MPKIKTPKEPVDEKTNKKQAELETQFKVMKDKIKEQDNTLTNTVKKMKEQEVLLKSNDKKMKE